MPTGKFEAKLTTTPDSPTNDGSWLFTDGYNTFWRYKVGKPGCHSNKEHSAIHRGKKQNKTKKPQEPPVIPNEALVEAIRKLNAKIAQLS